MITINTISATKFSFNGITYHKNFMPFVTGDKIAIINVYDGCITLTDAPTIYSDYTVNGVTYGSVSALQAALLDVIYTRSSLLATITGTLTNNYLPKAASGGTVVNSLIYDNGTNVGIGTTAPSEKLEVVGNIYVNGGSLKSFISGLSALRTYTKNAQFEISSYQSVGGSPYTKMMDIVSNADSGVASEMRFLTTASGSNPSEALRITSTGNVGIGTTAPAEKLEVVTSGAYTTIYTGANGNGASGLACSSDNRTNTWFVGSRKDSIGGATGTDRFNILYNTNSILTATSNGNVGIATTAPTSKLHVNGLQEFIDNAAAIAGGLTVGAFYHTAGTLKVVI